MNILDKLLHPRKTIFALGIRGGFRFLKDESYLKLLYWCRFGKKLNLTAPETFNEKLQWLKIHNHNALYTKLVDKYEVKQYVSEKLGKDYIIPTIGVWDAFDDIDFDLLPNQFVLKCTHDSGGLVICRDKEQLDLNAAKKKINQSLKRNYYWAGREYPYKEVRPRIIAEKYIEDTVQNKRQLIDYKFYCFNGIPQFIYISEGLENHRTARISFLKMNWEEETFQRKDYRPFEKIPPKPENFELMMEAVQKLSEGFAFIRVDMYSVCGKIYFSELTLCPCSGYMPFIPEQADKTVGDYLKL